MKSNTILFFLSNIVLLFLGLFWIVLHLFVRLIMERPSYQLADLKPFLADRLLIFFLFFVLIHLSLLLSSIYYIYRQHFPLHKESVIKKILAPLSKVIDTIYNKPIEHFQNLIFPEIPGSGKFFIFLTDSNWRYRSFSYFYILIFILDFLPKLVVAGTFCIELTLFAQVKYFLHLLPLLLITASFNIFLSAYTSFAQRCLEELKEFLEHAELVPEFEPDGVWKNKFTCHIRLKEEYKETGDVQEISDLYIVLRRITDLSTVIKEAQYKMSPYFLFITSFLYVFGGVYRLIFLLS